MKTKFSERSRSLHTLKHEEKIALWSLRTLLGPRHEKGKLLLARLLGNEARSLQEYFQNTFSLHIVQTTHSVDVSSTEFYLLQTMAEMQEASQEKKVTSALRKALLHLSMTLAAHGYWLSSSSLEVSPVHIFPQAEMLQDNMPLLMQAAE